MKTRNTSTFCRTSNVLRTRICLTSFQKLNAALRGERLCRL